MLERPVLYKHYIALQDMVWHFCLLKSEDELDVNFISQSG